MEGGTDMAAEGSMGTGASPGAEPPSRRSGSYSGAAKEREALAGNGADAVTATAARIRSLKQVHVWVKVGGERSEKKLWQSL